MQTPLINVFDVAYPRLYVPDLGKMETFLKNFGMVRARLTGDTLYMRGTGTAPFVHVSHLADGPGFAGFAMLAASRDDLDILAAQDGFSPVEKMDSPGGGFRTTITDPHGFELEVIYGQDKVAPLPDNDRRAMNMGQNYERIGDFKRIPKGPSRIKRFGHLQLNVPDIHAALSWYQERFGFAVTDLMKLDDGNTAAVFSRCFRPEQSSDHHNLLFTREYGGITGLNHVSWEVCDMDDVYVGHEHLLANKYTPEWGIGRHVLGAQIFDYWNDPWGQIHEHWTDGDQISPNHEMSVVGTDKSANQWGPDMPDTYRRTSSPLKP